jgi:hypothetical protein
MVPHLLGHLVLMAVVAQIRRTVVYGFNARGIDVAAGNLPGIAPRGGSVHRPGGSSSAVPHPLMAFANPAAAANRPTFRPKVLISMTFSSFGPCEWGALKGKGVTVGLTTGEFGTTNLQVGDGSDLNCQSALLAGQDGSSNKSRSG